jgi:hypothetical protein
MNRRDKYTLLDHPTNYATHCCHGLQYSLLSLRDILGQIALDCISNLDHHIDMYQRLKALARQYQSFWIN